MSKSYKILIPLFLFMSFGISGLLSAQTYSDFIKLADESYRNKDYLKSAENYEKALEQKEGKTKDSNEVYYKAARSWALAGNTENALKSLNLLTNIIDMEASSGFLEYIKTDSTLASLHNKKGWNTLIKKLNGKIEKYEANFNKELVKELKDISEKDQRYRKQLEEVSEKYGWQSKELKELWEKQAEFDSSNLVRVETIIKKYGYPGKSLVGGMLSSAAFLVIQHSDLKTQEKYLPLLQEAADKGEFSWGSLALLIDRIHTGKGEKQIYGSQIRQTGGKHELFPIEDESNVNKRRAKVGLEPLEEYVKYWNMTYTVPDSEETQFAARMDNAVIMPVFVDENCHISNTLIVKLSNLTSDCVVNDTLHWESPEGWSIEPNNLLIKIAKKGSIVVKFKIKNKGERLYPTPQFSLLLPYAKGKKYNVTRSVPVIRKVYANKTTTPLSIDGKISEPVWRKPVSLLFSPNGNSTKIDSTYFYFCYDDSNLYVSAYCKKSKIDSIFAASTEHDEAVYNDDCIGYFFQPDTAKNEVYQIYFNSLGTAFDQKISGMDADRNWNGVYEVKTSKGNNFWTVEARIPLSQFGVSGKPGQQWRLNFRRKQKRTQSTGDWQVPITYDPNTYGILIMK
ncbi:MAG: sugar-binding protein [bacterium]|nr:sugar-binding protein [bacterium]